MVGRMAAEVGMYSCVCLGSFIFVPHKGAERCVLGAAGRGPPGL